MPPSVKSPAPPESRAGRKRERTRAAILDATRRACADHGYQAATIADIAAIADVGVGTVYYHFATKDDLLEALMHDFLTRFGERIQEIRVRVFDPRARLRAGYLHFFSLGEAERELLHVYFNSSASRADFAETLRQFFLDDATQLMREGQADGTFRAGDPVLLAHWWIGATSEALRWLLERREPLTPAGADAMSDLALHGLMRDTAPAHVD